MRSIQTRTALFCCWPFAVVVGVLFACHLPCCAEGVVVGVNTAHGLDFNIEATRVVSYGTETKPLFEVTCRFSFVNLATVWLKGVGTVPAKSDHLSFFSTGRDLEFRKAAGAKRLVSVHLSPTFFPAAPGPVFPGLADFHNPGPKRSSSKSLADVTTGILGIMSDFANIPPKSCPAPWESNCLITAWVTIPGVSKPQEGQLAIMITFVPSENATRTRPKTLITVAVEERETLIGSGVWHEAGDAVRDAAKAKLASLSIEVEKLIR